MGVSPEKKYPGMMSLSEAHPSEVQDLTNSITNLFKIMEVIYIKGDCQFDQEQKKFFFASCDDFGIDWMILEDALEDNDKDTAQGSWELFQLDQLREIYEQIDELVEDLKFQGVKQELLTYLWMDLWEMYEGIYPGVGYPPEKAGWVNS